MKLISKTGLVTLSLLVLSSAIYAESGNCVGKTTDGRKISVTYFTNGYSDDNIDFYAKIKLGSEGPATYALSVSSGDELEGDATNKSKHAGFDFGSARLRRSSDNLSMSGDIGGVEFKNLRCSYRE